MKNPSTPSRDHVAMAPYWSKVSAIMGGVEVMRTRPDYLPQFPDEDDKAYEFRRKNARMTNVYRDIVENLAQRPFSAEVVLSEDTPEKFIEFSDNVDGRGSSIHSFAGDVFFAGINSSIDWILVDYSSNEKLPADASVEDERIAGVRPFWVRYPAESVIAVRSQVIAGVEQIVHARLMEVETVMSDDFEETEVKQVRVFNREVLDDVAVGKPTFELWREVKDRPDKWELFQPARAMTIDEIPLVPFATGRRIGSSWTMHPPMRDAADLQVELFQQESALKNIWTLTGFPMLSANGIDPEVDGSGEPVPIRVSPHTVLYGGVGASGTAGSWGYIEPNSQSLRFLADNIKDTIRELRELGRQPLTAQSGNLTVVTTAFAAQKGNAAIQAWALNLKAALERCLTLTGKWVKEEFSGDVVIDTEFDLGYGDDESFAHVLTMATAAVPMISTAAAIREAVRRGSLDRSFRKDEDELELLDEEASDDEVLPNKGNITALGRARK